MSIAEHKRGGTSSPVSANDPVINEDYETDDAESLWRSADEEIEAATLEGLLVNAEVALPRGSVGATQKTTSVARLAATLARSDAAGRKKIMARAQEKVKGVQAALDWLDLLFDGKAEAKALASVRSLSETMRTIDDDNHLQTFKGDKGRLAWWTSALSRTMVERYDQRPLFR